MGPGRASGCITMPMTSTGIFTGMITITRIRMIMGTGITTIRMATGTRTTIIHMNTATGMITIMTMCTTMPSGDRGALPTDETTSQPILLAREPFAGDDAVGPLGLKLAVEDRPAGGELHREAGVVLVVDD